MMEKLTHAVQVLLTILRIFAVVLLVSSVGINFANIIGRYFFHAPIFWAEEAMLFLMVGCVFLGIGQAAWSGQHIRMDVFVRLMPPPVRAVLDLLSDVTLIVTGIALSVFAWPTVQQLEAFDQRSLAAGIPLVIPQGMIPLGLALMALLVACRLLAGRGHAPSPPSEH